MCIHVLIYDLIMSIYPECQCIIIIVNEYTKTKVLIRFGSLEVLCVEMRSKKNIQIVT